MSTATFSINGLPVELQQHILTYLPVQALISYAQTSKHNYATVLSVLKTLHLAVLPRRIHGVLAFLNASLDSSMEDEATLHQMVVPTISTSKSPSLSLPITKPKKSGNRHSRSSRSSRTSHPDPKIYRHQLIEQQTNLAGQVLSSPLLKHLTTLSVHTYSLSSPSPSSSPASTPPASPQTDLSPSLSMDSYFPAQPKLAETIATSLPSLRHLTLNFSHPYIHDPCLPAGSQFWNTPDRGTSAWNVLCGLGLYNESTLRLRGLESLEINRAGITARQIVEWVKRNPELKELKLKCVAGVEEEMVTALAELFTCDENGDAPMRARLTHLNLSNSPNLHPVDRSDFEWITSLVEYAGLEELNLQGCHGINTDILQEACTEGRWFEKGLCKLGLPSGLTISETMVRSASSPSLFNSSINAKRRTSRIGGLLSGNTGGSWSDDEQHQEERDGARSASSRNALGKLEVDPACL